MDELTALDALKVEMLAAVTVGGKLIASALAVANYHLLDNTFTLELVQRAVYGGGADGNTLLL